jgi:branched-chain amino acid transport system substrate-binding protein
MQTTTTAAMETTTTAASAGVSCDQPIVVGVITDITGPLAVYGAHMLRGVPAGFAYGTGGEVTDPADSLDQTFQLDNCEIHVIYKDDQSDPELSSTAARELIEVDGAKIIIGTVSSGVTATLQSLAAENNVILIAAPAAATDITGKDFDPNTFRASRSNYQDAVALCQNFVENDGYKTFVQIAPDYNFGYGGAAAYKDACTFFGGEFIHDDIFAPIDTTDFTSYLQPIAHSGADAFLVTWAGATFIPLFQAAIDLGVIDDKTVLGSPFVDNLTMPVLFSSFIGTTSIIIYAYQAPDNPVNDYLIKSDEEVFGTEPDLFDPDGMNAALMVVEALKATGGDASADALKGVLEGMSFNGPKGTIDIRPEDHVAIQDLYVVKLLNLDDPQYKFYQYVATVRPNPPCLLEGDYTTRCGDLPVGSLSGGGF